ncbi:hypothetical protein SAMN05444266_104295 [Chitinophaga jiangningensis]|uniref:Long-chain fatty acid transport protein n=1 Tax=Chitinophaga jiangningensis TaxID=1419482 RepID=A0A1M7CEF1_9BACT|nr:hypothetical protein [Chitinophaga jiangningensis]SHL65593.1 hypothetical protein SAMN05444266_104295 [Chitinophaga jiangningensis]
MIKSIYPLLGGLFLSVSAMAQSAEQALLFTNQQPSGTARTQALGGVSVGLGGDFSSAFTNPAGIGIFKTGEFLISGGVATSKNSSSYLPMVDPLDVKGSKSNFQIPNIGVVFVTNTNSGSNTWNNWSFGLGMNRSANFNNQVRIGGVTDYTSYTEPWREESEPSSYNPDYGSIGSALAYNQALLVEDNGKWISLAMPTGAGGVMESIYQRAQIDTKGGINDYVFSLGTNYGDRLYLGVSLNLPSITYKETLSVSEDDNTGNQNNDFGYFDYKQYTTINGLGFSGTLGILYKITDRFRIGGSLRLPTIYSMSIATSADLTSNTEGWKGKQSSSGAGEDYSYNMTAPLRASAGASYFFGNLQDADAVTGFLAADYEYVNHSSSKYRFEDADKGYEGGINQTIGFLYKAASNFKAGAEVKFARIFAARGGFAYYGNPYSNDSYNMGIDASRKTYSGGLGVRTKGIYFDVTYSYTQGKDYYQLYSTNDANTYPPAALLDFKRSNIMGTIGFKF